jgi:iron complex transport system substrate-binding protein
MIRRTLLGVLLAASSLLAGEAAAGEERIVALGGAVTEILYALGAQDRVVAVDTTSLHPPEAMREKPNVGYVRALSAEGILSMRPTLVVAVDGAGPPDALRLVEGAGVRLARVPDEPTPEGVARKIEIVGELVGSGERATRLAAEVRAGFARLDVERTKVGRPVRALFVLAVQNGRVLVGGRNTTADSMLRLAGAENAGAGIDGFKPMTDEALTAAAPDVVVMMRGGGAGHAGADTLFTLPGLAASPAASAGRLVTFDGLYLLGFGPRAPEAAGELMRAFYPPNRG